MTNESTARVAIVLVNWNGWRECIECIDSFMVQSHETFHAFVVDNDSQNESIEHIVSWCAAPTADPTWRRHPGVLRLTDRADLSPIAVRVLLHLDQTLPPPPEGCRLTLLRSGGNLGFAGGCNVGIKAAGLQNFDWFWFLNADTVVQDVALTELIRHAQRRPGIGIVGSTLRYYDQPDALQAMGGARLNRSNGMTRHIGQGARLCDVPTDGAAVERDMDYVAGASMLVSTQFISEIGLMAEDYFLYYEEIDWALRGGSRFSLGYAPRSHVFHKVGVNSIKTMPLFSLRFYYNNQIRFVQRYFPGRLAAVKRSLFVQMLRHIARGRWAHARLVLTTLLTANQLAAGVSQKR